MASRRLHWDGTITAGNLITGASMMIVLIVWGIRQEARIDQNAYRIGEVEEQVEQSMDTITHAVEMVEARLVRQIEGLSESIDRIENILLRPERSNP
ncbi:MAG: hypothetical protein AAF414_17160 [Pseudomonadota bacterium]